MALGVGIAVLLLSWLLYDAAWTLLAGRPAAAALVSLLLISGIAQGLAEFMTGRAVFIHIGATLGIILVNDMNRRPFRIANNAVLPPALLLLMSSNPRPLAAMAVNAQRAAHNRVRRVSFATETQKHRAAHRLRANGAPASAANEVAALPAV